jgi:hypothetical protein
MPHYTGRARSRRPRGVVDRASEKGERATLAVDEWPVLRQLPSSEDSTVALTSAGAYGRMAAIVIPNGPGRSQQ